VSTIQNTRLAEAYGCWVMTWATKAMNGWMPVDGAQRPKTLAWPTS
jgi:hypothetical protein